MSVFGRAKGLFPHGIHLVVTTTLLGWASVSSVAALDHSPDKGKALGLLPPAPVEQTGSTVTLTDGDDGDRQAGVELPEPRFTDNGNGTITDNLTGLMWLKDVTCLGRRTWFDALAAVSDLNAGFFFGCAEYTPSLFSDWRGPNVKELLSLANYRFFGPPISNTQGDEKWSEGDPFLGLPGLFGAGSTDDNAIWSSTVTPSGSRAFKFVVPNGNMKRSGFAPIPGQEARPFTWAVRNTTLIPGIQKRGAP